MGGSWLKRRGCQLLRRKLLGHVVIGRGKEGVHAQYSNAHHRDLKSVGGVRMQGVAPLSPPSS